MPLPTSWSWGKGQGKRLDPVHLVGGWKKASVQRALRILLYRVFLPFLSKLEKEMAVQESQARSAAVWLQLSPLRYCTPKNEGREWPVENLDS